jgi:DNA-binding transcriptional regulator LsrR (DeoR family)
MTSASVLDRPVEEILQARFGVDRAAIVKTDRDTQTPTKAKRSKK